VETLFHATVMRPWLGRVDPMTTALEYPAVEAVITSILTTMLLPMGKDRGVDSGLTGDEVRHARKRQYNADARAIVVAPDSLGALTENQPRLNGERMPPQPNRAAICDGFATMHQLLLTHRDALCGPTGPLGRLTEITTRTVLRDTAQYHNLLAESWHPSLLSDPHMVLGHFLNLWGLAVQRPATATAMADEMAQMMRGDVPYFLMQPSSVVMMRADGTPTAFSYDRSGADGFADRLQKLGPDNLAIQDWILRVSLDPGDLSIRPLYAESDPVVAPVADCDETAGAALVQVHRRLMSVARRGRGMIDWVGANPATPTGLVVAPADAGLYSGSAGFVLYLACHAAFTGAETDRSDALAAFATLERQLALPEDLPSRLGVMHGRGGIAYTLLHLHRLWDRPDLVDRAFALLTPDDDTPVEEVSFDLTDGAAGLVLVALAGFEMTQQARFGDLAQFWAQRLVAQCGADGAWVDAAGGRPLTGLAHGQSGPILALQRLSRLFPDPSFAETITRALACENTDFLPERQSWADWRLHNEGTYPDDAPPDVLFHWCNGSAGIALARLEVLRADPSATAIRDEAALGLRSLLDFGMGRDLSLCHGDLGNLDIAQTLQSQLELPGISGQIGALHSRAHRAILQGRMPGGLGDGVTSPGLMLGLCGMGFALLRRIDPGAAPDVLTLAAA
jgi:type 2 lantibiotic biosynthesis protein LanM